MLATKIEWFEWMDEYIDRWTDWMIDWWVNEWMNGLSDGGKDISEETCSSWICSLLQHVVSPSAFRSRKH